jgi:hypothetical protein
MLCADQFWDPGSLLSNDYKGIESDLSYLVPRLREAFPGVSVTAAIL